MKNCPRCEQPASASKRVQSATIDHEEAGQAKTCVVFQPDENASSPILLVFHTAADLAGGQEIPTEPPKDWPHDDQHVYDRLLNVAGPKAVSELAGELATAGLSPDNVEDAVDRLEQRGVVTRTNAGVSIADG